MSADGQISRKVNDGYAPAFNCFSSGPNRCNSRLGTVLKRRFLRATGVKTKSAAFADWQVQL